MNLKSETKEKFTVISPLDSELSANLSATFKQTLTEFQQSAKPHVIVNMKEVVTADDEMLEMLSEMQQAFYNDNHSFVICCLQENLVSSLERLDMIDTMNITPTESEAWDILQMEEIERELMTGFEDN